MPRHTKLVAEEQVTSVLAPRHVPVYERESNADDDALAALGYKPEFKREFTLWTSFCVSFAVLGLLPSFASTLYYVSAQSWATFAIAAADVSCSGHGLRGHTGHDVGMAHRHGFYPVRRNEHGRTVLRHADQWRPILCCRGPGPAGMGPLGLLSAP